MGEELVQLGIAGLEDICVQGSAFQAAPGNEEYGYVGYQEQVIDYWR